MNAWEKRKLGDLSTIRRGASPRPISSPKWFSGTSSVGWLRISDVTEQNGRVYSVAQHLSEKGQKKTLVLTKRHLILSIAATVGKPVQNYTALGIHDGFIVFMNPKFDLDFMFYFLEKYQPQWMRFGQPGSQVNLNSELVRNLEIRLPRRDEQEQVSKILLKLDNLIAATQGKLDQLQMVKKALLQHLFDQSMRFKGYSDPWEKRYLKDVIYVNSGRDYKHLSPGMIPVYGTGGYMLSVNEALSYEDAIGIGRKGTIDKPYLLKAPFWTVDTLFYLTVQDNMDISFVFPLLQTIRWKQLDESTGVPSLSKKTIESVMVHVPKKEEQKNLGNLFLFVDNLIAATQSKLSSLESLKKALLQGLFI